MTAALKVEVEERGFPSRKYQSDYRQGLKAAWWKMANWFVGRFTMARFTPTHGRAAGYTARKPRYQSRKKSQLGHMDPLVWSGEAQLSAGDVKITSTSKQAKINYTGLRKLNWRHPQSTINMREEFLTILPMEEFAATEQLENAIDGELKARRVVLKKRIK